MTGKSESGNEFRRLLDCRESGDARPVDNRWRPRAMISPARKAKARHETGLEFGSRKDLPWPATRAGHGLSFD
jgi:hypothetical protein